MTATNAAADAREAVAARREQLDEVLRRYGASNPRLFGSVARGDATTESDIDVLVDVVAAELLRDGFAEAALTDAVAL